MHPKAPSPSGFYKFWFGLTSSVLGGSLAASPSQAQTASPSPIPDRIPPTPPQGSTPDVLKPPLQTPVNLKSAPDIVPTKIAVKRFQVVGSTAFSRDKLNQVLAPCTDKFLAFTELLDCSAAITQLYKNNGYITSAAYISPQSFQEGVVTIQVVEGELEGINVTGTEKLDPEFIRTHIAAAISKPLNVLPLLENLQQLQSHPLIKEIKTELAAGSTSGKNFLQVKIIETSSSNKQLNINQAELPDESSQPPTLEKNNVKYVGLGDNVSLVYKNANDTNSLDASYTLPATGIETAQLPNPVTPTPPISPTPPPLPPPQDLLKPTPASPLIAPPVPSSPQTPTAGETPPDNAPAAFTVNRFDVVGSTVFDREEFDKILQPFLNKPLSFAELLQARSAVTQLYNDRGYITTGAYIPPQPFRDGVVRIEVVEGGLEAINITGTERLNPNYIRSRIAVATSKPLNVPRLVEALQLLQLNPLIQNLSAELSAGSRPGQNLLEVRVVEADTSTSEFRLDNGRSPGVGTFQRGIQLNEANFFGLGDNLSLGYRNTEGSNTFDARYTLPINPYNGTLDFSYSTAKSRIIEPPFDQVDIEANSRYFDITLRQPIVQTPNNEVALGLTLSRRESDTSLLGVPFPLSPGADEAGETRISALRFFQELTRRGTQQVFSARSEFSLGVNALNSTINETAPDSRFLAWRGQVQLARQLAPDTLLLLRGDAQLATRALLPLEQFSLGGIQSVRGYRQDSLLSDNGALISAEIRLPIYRQPRRQTLLQLIPFVDVGMAWNSSGNPALDPNTLASIGIGLQWQQGNNFRVRLDYGIPLISIPSSDRTWQENGLYFSIIYNPF